jgi:hypothetical protein
MICPGWLRNTILLISASWVAMITGMSHWCLASFSFSKDTFLFVAQAGLELAILFSQPPEYWDYRNTTLGSGMSFSSLFLSFFVCLCWCSIILAGSKQLSLHF